MIIHRRNRLFKHHITRYSPYCIDILDSGLIMPLNRFYSPLGYGREFFNYDLFHHMALEPDLVNLSAVPIQKDYHFYDDSCHPVLKSNFPAYIDSLENVFGEAWVKDLWQPFDVDQEFTF